MQHKSHAQKATVEEEIQHQAQLTKKTESALNALTSVDKDLARLRDLKENLEKENTFAFNDIIAARKVCIKMYFNTTHNEVLCDFEVQIDLQKL